jgi:hypothetical protein
MGIKSLAVGRDQRSRPAIVQLASLVLVGLVATAGAIDGAIVGAGILRPTSPVIGYIGMTLLLSGAAVSATALAVLAGNLVNRRTRGRTLPIFVTTEVVAVVLAIVQTWLLRNVVSQDFYRAFLLGSLPVLALTATVAAARFRSIRSHSNWVVTVLAVVAVLLFTAVAVAAVLLVYAFSSSPNFFT